MIDELKNDYETKLSAASLKQSQSDFEIEKSKSEKEKLKTFSQETLKKTKKLVRHFCFYDIFVVFFGPFLFKLIFLDGRNVSENEQCWSRE